MRMYLVTLGLMLFCSLVSASEQDYELNQHIRGTKWQWDGNGGEVVVFAANGYVEHEGWTQRGLVTRWEVIDKRTVRLTIERGRTQDKYAFLIFNDDITSYGGINFHRGDKLHTSICLDNEKTTASVNQTNSNVAPAQTTTIIDKNKPATASFAKLNNLKSQLATALLKAAELGDENSQIRLAICYHLGDGVEKDQVEAAKWLRKAAAEQGNARAQSLLGAWYTAGTCVEKDPVEAQKWFRKSAEQFRKEAEQGNAYAQYRLGNLYAAGWGVTQDKDEAAKWWRKAAEQGNEYAQKELNKLNKR